MQNMNLNEFRSELSVSSKQSGMKIKSKKRRFKEIDNAWDLNLDEGSNSMIAVHQQTRSEMSDENLSLSKGANRRSIKLNFKKINRICAELDIARGRKGTKGIKEQAKIMGSFAILMYDLQTDHLHKMKD